MKKSILTLSIVTLSTLFLNAINAYAIVMPGYERPILTADMKKQAASGHFESAEHIKLTMTRQDGAEAPTGLTLNIDDRIVHLVIVGRQDAGCGSVSYTAYAPEEGDSVAGHYFSLFLTDHTTRTCKDLQPYLWEASIREGTGCFGVDGTMDIVGNPQGVYTIQSVQ